MVAPNKMFLNSITGKQAGANSSVFRFEANSMQFVIDGVEQTPELLKRMRLEQRWLSHIAGGPNELVAVFMGEQF